MSRFYSFIIPVFNRPQELRELLHSISGLRGSIPFEVVVVEDGSSLKSESVLSDFQSLDITYFYKNNSGPGDSRNYGMGRAKGDYFIILDSDCILSQEYLVSVDRELNESFVECFGGPDAAHHSFNLRQKVISFVMTSFLTTGGVRGNKRELKRFEPRSFNMGLSKQAFEASGGFGNLHPGEDPELVQRLWELGYDTAFFPQALVFHKRRITWASYAKQIFKFGLARSILNAMRPKYGSLIFWLPVILVITAITSVVLALFGSPELVYIALIYLCILALVGMLKIRSVIAFFAVPMTFGIQLLSYAYGFIVGWFYLRLLKRDARQQFPDMYFKG